MQRRTLDKYHGMLEKCCYHVCSSMIVESRHPERDIINEAKKHDLLIISASEHHKLSESIFGYVEDKVINGVDCSVLITQHKREEGEELAAPVPSLDI
jgi:nucleotide-binding universal stress UspA family protein